MPKAQREKTENIKILIKSGGVITHFSLKLFTKTESRLVFVFLLHCLIISFLQPKASLSHFYPFTLSHPFLSMASTSSTLMPKMNRFSSPASSAISTLAPSMVPMVRAPLSMNFMFPVPEASVPAVEICSDRSAEGITEEQSGWHIQSHTQHIICNIKKNI